MQGIILKENGNVGDAERMFIQVSIWIALWTVSDTTFPQVDTMINASFNIVGH